MSKVYGDNDLLDEGVNVCAGLFIFVVIFGGIPAFIVWSILELLNVI